MNPILETTFDELKAEEFAGNYDFVEVFKYGVNPETLDDASRETFIISEVADVIASANGDNDGPPWLMLGKLVDGRFFFIEASCDYTGWG